MGDLYNRTLSVEPRHILLVVMLTGIQEKKLATFWVIAALKATLDTTDLTRVHELKEAAVAKDWTEAWVLLDHKPCKNVSLPFFHGTESAIDSVDPLTDLGLGMSVLGFPQRHRGNDRHPDLCANCSLLRSRAPPRPHRVLPVSV